MWEFIAPHFLPNVTFDYSKVTFSGNDSKNIYTLTCDSKNNWSLFIINETFDVNFGVEYVYDEEYPDGELIITAIKTYEEIWQALENNKKIEATLNIDAGGDFIHTISVHYLPYADENTIVITGYSEESLARHRFFYKPDGSLSYEKVELVDKNYVDEKIVELKAMIEQ